MKFYVRLIAVVILISALSVAVFAAFKSSDKADEKVIFSNRTMLAGLWNNYKNSYWESSTGRTIDKQTNNITTSEGQSYTMLRAVWQSDKTTFDKAWAWTKEQLQRSDDHLFSWKWGIRADKTYGILTDDGGSNTASDADSDIALALVMAASRWQQKSYLDEAKQIIPNIWSTEVGTYNGAPYLVSNNLEKASNSDTAIVNPSYLAPYAYRVFAKIDTTNNWTSLVDSSYALINESIDNNLDVTASAKLVPNWILINKTTGAISAPSSVQTGLDTNYGYDAFRTPFRLALDYTWNKDERAKTTLGKMSVLSEKWSNDSKLVAKYTHDGTDAADYEEPAMYGASLGYFIIQDSSAAKQIYSQKLLSKYNQNSNSWTDTMTYYADNWAWFGMALYNNQLDNLAKDI